MAEVPLSEITARLAAAIAMRESLVIETPLSNGMRKTISLPQRRAIAHRHDVQNTKNVSAAWRAGDARSSRNVNLR
jgi:hypothetical protein